jgi:hypothetical protein
MNIIQNDQPNHTKENIPPKKKKQQKWATFTYFGKETRIITGLFKNKGVQTNFRTTNTVKNTKIPSTYTYIFNNGGIYQLKCKDYT